MIVCTSVFRQLGKISCIHVSTKTVLQIYILFIKFSTRNVRNVDLLLSLCFVCENACLETQKNMDLLASVILSTGRKGISVWYHLLSGCLVPCSFWVSLSLVPCSFQGISVQGVSVHRSLSRGSLSRGIFVWGVCVQGCLCQGDPRTETPSGTVKSRWYESYWNAFLLDIFLPEKPILLFSICCLDFSETIFKKYFSNCYSMFIWMYVSFNLMKMICLVQLNKSFCILATVKNSAEWIQQFTFCIVPPTHIKQRRSLVQIRNSFVIQYVTIYFSDDIFSSFNCSTIIFSAIEPVIKIVYIRPSSGNTKYVCMCITIITLVSYGSYCPQMKLREGSVFTRVCQSFCSQGVSLTDPPGQRPPYTVNNGRYASYWNAF